MKQKMYIGPSIPGVVKNSAVYYGDLPKELSDAAKICPSINDLVIPIEEITGAKKALSEPGSVINVSYDRVEKYLKGEK